MCVQTISPIFSRVLLPICMCVNIKIKNTRSYYRNYYLIKTTQLSIVYFT